MDFTTEEFIYIVLWNIAMGIIIYLIVHDDYEDDDDDDDDN